MTTAASGRNTTRRLGCPIIFNANMSRASSCDICINFFKDMLSNLVKTTNRRQLQPQTTICTANSGISHSSKSKCHFLASGDAEAATLHFELCVWANGRILTKIAQAHTSVLRKTRPTAKLTIAGFLYSHDPAHLKSDSLDTHGRQRPIHDCHVSYVQNTRF